MLFLFYMRRWFHRQAGSSRRARPTSLPHRRRALLRIEDLEGRMVPSTVTTLDDAGPGSLRQALLDTPAGGTVDFQPGLSGTITLTSGQLAINKNLTIAGPGPDVITVNGNHASRVLNIAGAFTVDISGLTLADGFTQQDASAFSGNGGAILNFGNLTVTGCTISGNFASGGSIGGGGGIFNDAGATLAVTGSTISGNSSFYGGGIDNEDGTVTVTGTTLSRNASAVGGGILNTQGSVTVADSTLSGNSAGLEGGGIFSQVGSLTVTDSTLSGNSVGGVGGGRGGGGGLLSGGGGIDVFSGRVTVTGSTFSGNSASGTGSTRTGLGGGILDEAQATLTVTDSTFSGNFASNSGGIFSEDGFAVQGLVTIDGDHNQLASGTLTLGAGNTLVLAGLGTINGGLSNAGTLALGDATGPGQLTTSRGLTNNGAIGITAGSTLTVTGGALINQAGATLTLGGTLTANGDLINDGEIDPAGDSQRGGLQTLTVGGTLTNAPDGTIAPQIGDAFVLNAHVDNQGTFTIAEDTMLSGSLINSGTLTLASVVGQSLTVTGGDVASSGTFLIGLGDSLSVDGNYTQTGGSTQLNSGQLTATGLVDLEGGVLGGTGTVLANVLNNADVDVGQPGCPGVLTIVGDYTQTTSGILVIEIGGPNAGTDFDQLAVTGQATLDGTLTVNLTGFGPNSGDSFPVLTFGSGTGVFASVDGDGPLFTPSYDAMDVTLVAN
jgi:hypothetical protein